MTTALVLGSAACMFDDVARLEEMIGHEWDGPVIACNDAGWLWTRRLDHWVSFHADVLLTEWLPRRADSSTCCFWSEARKDVLELEHAGNRITHTLVAWDGGTNSGVLALQVGLHVAKRAVLCGIPLDERAHVEGSLSGNRLPVHRGWRGYAQGQRYIRAVTHLTAERARSMSGLTRDIFGEPTAEWVVVDADTLTKEAA